MCQGGQDCVRAVVTKTSLAALGLKGGLAHPGAPRDGSFPIPGMNSECFYPSKIWSGSLLWCLFLLIPGAAATAVVPSRSFPVTPFPAEPLQGEIEADFPWLLVTPDCHIPESHLALQAAACSRARSYKNLRCSRGFTLSRDVMSL